MTPWWEITTAGQPIDSSAQRAVAYYRHSAQDRQENSIPIQQDQVRAWAAEHGIEIIQEFCDHGKSGLTAEGRPAFNDMMDNWVKQRKDFAYVLCLDVSRWGRFQDIDLSAQYSGDCRRHGKQVVYTTLGKPREDDPLYPIYIHFERFRAAQYSKELSDKVWRGCAKISEQGYWAGGPPPYGLKRLLLDERRNPVGVLDAGQRKSIQNQRITLVAGAEDKATVIRRIFHEFVELAYSEERIAEGLNYDGIASPSGGRWTSGCVHDRLRNEKYTGTMVYNQTSQKLKRPRRPNPPDKWIRTPAAFEGIVPPELFERAQQILRQRLEHWSPEAMMQSVRKLYRQHGFWHSSLLHLEPEAASEATYRHRFGSLDSAFQEMFREALDRVRNLVHERIRQQFADVLAHGDFLVLDRKLTVSIQAAVPMTRGYSSYWPLRPDRRPVIDLTLGVLVSDPDECDILGYVILPRRLGHQGTLRLGANSWCFDVFACTDLTFLHQLLGNEGGTNGRNGNCDAPRNGFNSGTPVSGDPGGQDQSDQPSQPGA